MYLLEKFSKSNLMCQVIKSYIFKLLICNTLHFKSLSKSSQQCCQCKKLHLLLDFDGFHIVSL